MQKLSMIILFIASSFVYADTSILDNDNRYIVFGIGESQSLSKRNAVAVAERIAKQSGKKYEIVDESYSKFTGGILWKCRLQVAFYNFNEESSQEGTFCTIGIDSDKGKAIKQASDKLFAFVLEEYKPIIVEKQVCQKIFGQDEWLCIFYVRFEDDNTPQVETFEIPGFAKKPGDAHENAKKEFDKIKQQQERELYIVQESYQHFTTTDSYLCILTVSSENLVHLVATGLSSDEAIKSVMTKIETMQTSLEKSLQVRKVCVTKQAGGDYLCTVIAQH